jgi:protein-tyrosine phosphatase
MMTQQPGANIPIPSLPNLRDLGGWPARGGRVRHGLAYRSTELHRLHGDDMGAFARLGIRSVYDLRTEAERTQQPDQLPPGVEHVVVDVLADSTDAAPAQLASVLSDPAAAEAMLGDGKVMALFEQGYREFLTLPSAKAAYKRLFTEIAQAERRPTLFHCTTGKDRTGWAAAALLTLLGVPDDLVMEEFLLTNAQLLPALQPLFDQFEQQGGDPNLLRPVLGVQSEYLAAALDEMESRYGTIEEYFATGLGIDAGRQQMLRTVFIE